MQLTPQQQALLDGARGETMAKVVKTLVMYGDTFGAQRMVPVTSEYGHTVISFGLAVMKPVYDLYDRLIESGLTSGQKFTADPLPLDKHVPTSLLEDIVFRKIMYTQQDRYEQQLKKLGITADNAYTCTCYLEQVGNTPKQGDILSWAESSAVVYANSVLGAVQQGLLLGCQLHKTTSFVSEWCCAGSIVPVRRGKVNLTKGTRWGILQEKGRWQYAERAAVEGYGSGGGADGRRRISICG